MGDLTPEFQVVTQSFQHPRDEWSGLLNLPSEFRVHSRSDTLTSRRPSELSGPRNESRAFSNTDIPPALAVQRRPQMKRAFIPAAPPASPINIRGERNVEWAFLSTEMPNGPGEAIEFGCEEGYMSLLAATAASTSSPTTSKSKTSVGNTLVFEFRQGDFLKLNLPRNHFDLAINCSSVEHVGVAGRYGIEVNEEAGDIEVMQRLVDILKPGGLLLMTAPCGRGCCNGAMVQGVWSSAASEALCAFRVAKDRIGSRMRRTSGWPPLVKQRSRFNRSTILQILTVAPTLSVVSFCKRCSIVWRGICRT